MRVPFSGGPNFDFRKAYWSVRQAYADVLSQPTEEKEVGQRFGGGFWESVSLWFPFESQPKRGPPIGEKTSRWTCALLHSFRVALLLFFLHKRRQRSLPWFLLLSRSLGDSLHWSHCIGVCFYNIHIFTYLPRKLRFESTFHPCPSIGFSHINVTANRR